MILLIEAIQGSNLQFQGGVLLVALILIQCSKRMDILPLPNCIVGIICFAGVFSFWIMIDFIKHFKVYNFVHYSFMNYAIHKPIQQFYNKIIAMCFKPRLTCYLINLYGGGVITVFFILAFVMIAFKLNPRYLNS